MGQSPEELRYDIERTREGMDATLDQIEDRVSPRRIAERRTERVRGAWYDVRDRVMGTVEDARQETRSLTDQAGAQLDEAGGAVQDRLDQLEEKGRRQYQGNPLAAGLIAFGAGALLGSLLPQTEREQQVADGLRERLEPVADELKAAGQGVADDLKEEARERAEATRDTAVRAAETVKEDARGAAEDLKDESRQRADHVKDEAQR